MRSVSWAWALILASCADSDPGFVSAPGLEADVGFVLSLDDSGSPIDVQGPLALDDGAPIRVVLPDQGAEVLLFVGWTHEALAAAVPSYDPDRANALQLETGAETCPRGRLSVDGAELEISLPENARWLSLNEKGGWRPSPSPPAQLANLGALRLRLAPDTTRCLGDGEFRFAPYGGIDPIVAAGDLVAGRVLDSTEAWFRDLARLPDGRIVATTKYSVVLLDRGVPFSDGPGRAVSLLDPRSPLALRDVVVDLDETRGNGGLRVFVSSVDDLRPEQSMNGALFELRLGPNGLELVGTALTANGPIERLVLRPEDGRLLAGSRPGLIYTMLPGEDFEAVMLPNRDDKRVDIFLTGLPDRPYAIIGTAAGTLLLGDPSARQWEIERGLPDGAVFRAFAVRRPEGQTQLWAGSSNGTVYHQRPDGSWRDASPQLGTPYGACFSRDSACGWFQPAQSARALVPLDDYVPPRILLAVDGCSGLVAIRSDLACAVLVPMGERPIQASALDLDFKTFEVSEDWVTAATQDGSLYELPRRPE